MSSLKSQLASGKGIVAPGAHDALAAVLAQEADFEAIYLSGFAFEATQLGAPDMAIATLRELSTHAGNIVTATDLPVICDVDTGFGGPNNVHRTVREMERVGVTAIQIEDQAEPKRCPFLGGRQVVSREAGAARIRIAAEARTRDDMLIIARTDADEVSTDEVVARCQLYYDAGADLVLPMVRNLDGVALTDRTPEERMALYQNLVNLIDRPMVALDPPPGFTAEDLIKLGISMVILPLASLEASSTAMLNYYHSLRTTGSSDAYRSDHPARVPANLEMMNMLGLEEYLKREDTLPAS